MAMGTCKAVGLVINVTEGAKSVRASLRSVYIGIEKFKSRKGKLRAR